jgi:hypothetical protein
MSGRKGPRFLMLAVVGSVLCALGAVVPAAQAAGAASTATGALVTVGSPKGNHPQNSQNEPALAVDPAAPNILAAGANDLVDMQPCSQKASTTAGACSFPLGTFNLGVGLTGVYFSFDSGHHWIQPTYQGLTAAGYDPTSVPCTPQMGAIHTVPNFFENGLRSRTTRVAFGPVLKNGTFSYANGTRLYFATLATNLTDTKIQQGGINSNFAITVSHIDNLTPARVADQSNWSAPVRLKRTSPPRRAWIRSRSGRTTQPPARSSATCTCATATSTASARATTSPCSRRSLSLPTAAKRGRRTTSPRRPPRLRRASGRGAPSARTATGRARVLHPLLRNVEHRRADHRDVVDRRRYVGLEAGRLHADERRLLLRGPGLRPLHHGG